LSTSPPPVRLDFFEEIFCRGYLDSGDGIGAITVALSGALDEAALRRAAEHLQILHPGFRSRVAVRDTWMEWILSAPGEAPPIPLEVRACAADPLPWEEACHQIFQEGLDFTRGQMGRVCVLHNPESRRAELIIAGHHLVLSGNSGISVFHDLLDAYEKILLDPASPAPAPQPLRHSSGNRLRVPFRSYASFLPWYIRHVRMSRRAFSPLPLAPTPEPDPSLWERRVFSAAETRALILGCRRHRTTLLGLLAAGSLWALHRVQGRWDVSFQCTAPLDLHHAFVGADGPLRPHEHGSFVGRFTAISAVAAGDRFWDVARTFSDRANAEAKSGCPAIMHRLLTNRVTRVACLPWLPSASRLEKRYPGRGKATLNISNTGIAPFRPRYGGLTVEAVGIAMQQRVRGANLKVNCLVVNNRLNLNLNPWQGIDRAFVRAFRGRLIELLVALAADADHDPRAGQAAPAGGNGGPAT
jgi:hypothetical protein